MTVQNLENELNKGILRTLYLLHGEERYILEATLKKIKKLFGECIQGINYIKIEENNISNIINDIETPAFGYEKKLIIAKNTSLFSKNSKKQKTEYTEKISTYISENIDIIKNSVVLVFVEEEIGKNKLTETIEKNGCICNFEKLKLHELKQKIISICKAYKVNINDSTTQYFIENCGTSMQKLINEIRKLIEYVGEGGTIKKEYIDRLSIKELDSVIFDLTDSLGRKDTRTAIEVLHGLLYNKEPIQKILITLYNHLKKLYIVKLSQKYNKDILINLKLKPNQTFLVNKYKKQADYFKEKELRNILKELTNLDYNYKQGNIDINIGLEAILCSYF